MTGCGNFRRETVHVPLSLAPAPHLKPHLLLDHLIISFPQCDTASSSSPSQIRSNYSSLHRRCCHVALDYFKATAWNMHRGRVRVRGGCGEGVGSHQKNSCYHWTVFEGTVWWSYLWFWYPSWLFKWKKKSFFHIIPLTSETKSMNYYFNDLTTINYLTF